MEGGTPIRYTIPIYQRNYAWGDEQIEALITDVLDAFLKSRNSIFYIGTLVTYKRTNSDFEVIDGQQRLTTIYLILKCLGVDVVNTLTYTARKLSARTIENVPDFNDGADRAIAHGYEVVKGKIRDVEATVDIQAFKSFFLNNVHIIYYQVPKDVDLNHYFEVMNSRGEQLEMHEIVKAMLSEPLAAGAESSQISIFNAVWEACSEMNVYIQQRLSDSTIFGSHLDRFTIDSFEGIPQQSSQEQKCSILSLLNQTTQGAVAGSGTQLSDKFQPIIDFPNFLLIVLKLTLNDDRCVAVALDDKELLKAFTDVWSDCENRADFARTFAYNLLKARYLLDNYIVHHDMSDIEQLGNNPWKLGRYYKDGRNGYPRQLSADDNVQTELVHLLSMFEVTFTAKQRKNYLFYCLKYLFDRDLADDTNFEDYLRFLQQLADKYFYDIYLNRALLSTRNLPKPNTFDEAIICDGKLCLGLKGDISPELFTTLYVEGSDAIPLYVFNYTDYRLWKRYALEMRGEGERSNSSKRTAFFESLGCSDFGLRVFDNFYFSRTRKSLEHYYPQSKAVKGDVDTAEALSTKSINCYGNFAMIGAEANSSGNNLDPVTKLIRYNDRGFDPISVASLKFKIMMRMCQDNKDSQTRPQSMEWNREDMHLHTSKMLDILFK